MINLKDLEAEIRKIAEEYPDVFYVEEENGIMHSCFYKPTKGNPHGCIIGFALPNLGYTKADQVEGTIGIRFLVQENDDDFHLGPGDDQILDWLATVQDYQDIQYSWSGCIKKADSQAGIPETYYDSWQ